MTAVLAARLRFARSSSGAIGLVLLALVLGFALFGPFFAPHDPSETVGLTFDPSGTRLYFGSQRAFGTGVVYEVTGPFRGPRAAAAPPSSRP